jgi:protein-S-isoprenylcysteine O-methyltransferase Ste14
MNARLVEFRPPRIAMLLLATAAAWHWFLPTPVVFSARIPAILVGVGGFAIMMWAWWQFRERQVAICPTEKTDDLITDGVYRYTRNPMYLGMTLMLVAVATGTGLVPFYASAGAFLLVIDRVFCPYEEQKLARAFGQSYLDYRRRVRRWF